MGYESNNNKYIIPGGGLENEETLEEALEIFGRYEDFHKTNLADYGLYRREYFALKEYFDKISL